LTKGGSYTRTGSGNYLQLALRKWRFCFSLGAERGVQVDLLANRRGVKVCAVSTEPYFDAMVMAGKVVLARRGLREVFRM
jgi:hypothetical protein